MPGDNMINIEYDEFKELEKLVHLQYGWLKLDREDGLINVNINQIVTYGFYKQKVPNSGIAVAHGS